MAYDKQNFKSGTKLYAKQLNAMDDKLADNDDRLDAYAQAINNTIDKANELDANKIYGAYVENGYLFLTSNGQVVVGNLGPFSGTGGGAGGGSGDNNAKLTVKNTSGWLSKVIGEGQSCNILLNWTSIEDGVATGNGTIKITVNNIIKASYDIPQGDVTVNVTDYLDAGSNVIKITISDAYGNARTINFSITVASISLTSTFDPSLAYDGDITFPYTPTGNVNKTMHFKMDGTEFYTFETTSSNRQLTYIIPKQSNGSHILEVYFTASVDGNELTSNVLRYDIICSDANNETVIITSSFAETTVKQYETVKIDFYVYNPKSLTSTVKLIADSVTVSDMIGVDRTMQSWSYRFDKSGSHTLKIKCGTVEKVFDLTVARSDVTIEAETNDLELYLTSYGRSNNESTKNVWEFGSISAVMSNFNFVSDGWVLDDDGNTVLRVSGDARITIPFKMFKDDFRTTGKTIEFEFATRDVLNYDSILFSCISEDRGLEFTAQKTFLSSEQSTVSTQYKENEHCRITFVIEKRSENRLIWVYINGIASGTIQYPANDDFTQGTPLGISIGSNSCTLDIYTIRVYNNSLTRFQILDNYIADTHNIDLMLERYNRNDIFDEYDRIVISKLPKDLPYLILTAPELPQSKGDKKTVSGQYVDPVHPEFSFTFENAIFDVQGTSSAGYARKNYKGKFKGGFLQNGKQVASYSMRTGAIPVSTFTFKADVASSEGANNVELVRLYNDLCPYKTDPQKVNSSIRQGIDGFPIVIFWNNGTETTFLGKYNFNNDKGTEEVYGFAAGDESWEFLNNTSDRSLFRSANFTGDDWLNDFEGRYPDGNTDSTNLATVVSWVASTANDIAKFKSEFSNYFELQAMTFYYLFTEIFLMVDSRAKNQFITKMGTSKWFMLPYDFDTAIGINNEGTLAFSYNLEDIDQVDSADVFNGQQSVLWKNFRTAFYDNIKSMYATLRSSGKFSYEYVNQQFEDHQSKWPEAIFNEDAYYKYIQPLMETGTSAYLSMLQGSKAEQRKWWLYNRFRYMDSKYVAGDSLSDIITLRGYAKANITVTPYADIYASVKYGSYLVQKRATRNVQYTLECPLDNVNDTEIYVYNCSQISAIGDISPFKVGYAEFSKATKPNSLKIGDAASSYRNTNLKELYLGNNTLLKTLDVRNCPNLTMAVDVSGCINIEEVYFDGTGITGIQLPNGGNLKKLHLPNTITNLTLRNQMGLTEFIMSSYMNVSTLWLENIPTSIIDPIEVLEQIKANSRVRVIGFSAEMNDPNDIQELFNKFDGFRGLDEHGNNVDKPQISGTIHTGSITSTQLVQFRTQYPDIVITYDSISYVVEFYNGDTLLQRSYVIAGQNAVFSGTNPTKEQTDDYRYTYIGWSMTKDSETADANPLTNIQSDKKFYAAFSKTRHYLVIFRNVSNIDGLTISELGRGYVDEGSDAVYYGATPTRDRDVHYIYSFAGWTTSDDIYADADSNALKNITSEKVFYAAYARTTIYYTVRFYNGTTLLETGQYTYGETPSYSGSTPTQGNAPFIGWIPEIAPVTKNIDYKAKFLTAPILPTAWYSTDAYKAVNKAYELRFIPDVKNELSNVGLLSTDGTEQYIGNRTLNDGTTQVIVTWDSSASNEIMLPTDSNHIFNLQGKVTHCYLDNVNATLVDAFDYAFYNTGLIVHGTEKLIFENCRTMHYAFASLYNMGDIDIVINVNHNYSVSLYNTFSKTKAKSIDISSLKKITNMQSVFSNTTVNNIILPKKLNLDSQMPLSYAFEALKCPNAVIDMSEWRHESNKALGMANVFNGAKCSKVIIATEKSPLCVYNSFASCFSEGTYTIDGLEYVTIDSKNSITLNGMFSNYKNSKAILDMSSWNIPMLTDLNLFLFMSTVKEVKLPHAQIVRSNPGSRWFMNMTVESISGFNNITGIEKDTGSMWAMFNGLTPVGRDLQIDISSWNLSNIIGFSNNFITEPKGTYKVYLTIPATNGNGIANTSSRMYGKDETTYYDFPTSDKLIITVASA
jgi:hypothetical protein